MQQKHRLTKGDEHAAQQQLTTRSVTLMNRCLLTPVPGKLPKCSVQQSKQLLAGSHINSCHITA